LSEGARAHFFGTHFREIPVGPFTCTLSRATIPIDQLPEHIHDQGHLILALDPGYLSRALDDAGGGFDLIYSPPGTVHRDCFVEPGGRFLSVDVPAGMAPQLADPVRLRSCSAIASSGRLLGLCVSGRNAPLLIEEQLLLLLGEAAPTDSRHSPAWLDRADELIEASAVERVGVSALAGALGLHPVYFARAYRKARGYGPAHSLQMSRVRRAASLMSRDISLAEIAASCGFADQSHLCRSMRRFADVAPSALRGAFSSSGGLQMFKTRRPATR
jgi:AraC family transcriptional regulator